MGSEHTFYFAYGSNMDAGQMGERVPGAERVCGGRLAGWALSFEVAAIRYPGGVATVRRSAGDAVWGVLWSLPPGALGALDALEVGYRRENLEVTRSGSPSVRAAVYVAPPEGDFRPSRAYLDRLVAGARDAGLPGSWLDRLEAWPTHG